MDYTENASEVGTFLRIWDHGGSIVDVRIEHEPSIDAAVTAWVDSGRTRDALLRLETMVGSTYKTLASEITSWLISTPDARQRAVVRGAAEDEERRHNRYEAGLFEEEG